MLRLAARTGRTGVRRAVRNASSAHSRSEGLDVHFEDIARASTTIRDGVHKTPMTHSRWLSELCGCEVWLKHEQSHFTGSFKERGALNALKSLDDDSRAMGVVAASAGNHALALAWHGNRLGIKVSVVMPVVAPLAKRQKAALLGANVVIFGANIAEAKAYAEQDPILSQMRYINGYDDAEIVAGAGTMGLEIVEQCSDVETVLVPTGGAGLLAGVSMAIKTLRPGTQVIGVEPLNCASFTAALEAGYPVAAVTTSTLADGARAASVARRYVDDVVCVSESQVALAVLRIMEMEKVVVEGGGATGLAAILPGGPLHEKNKGKKTVVPLCGGNIDITTLGRVIDRGLAADQRLVSDRSGGLNSLTTVLKEAGASVKDVFHERAWLHSAVDRVQIKVIIETTGPDHALDVKMALKAAGIPILVYQQDVIMGPGGRILDTADGGSAEPAPFE
ncbi:tryptophan synthase beta subunit-like PLP-dependent enzyme [Pelagophyceae sp. CCMP2097]|nr:tryptophan synthase beta subunit-like PLP-dependent enzyme [Pelagophyceae sp. CCMP2097]